VASTKHRWRREPDTPAQRGLFGHYVRLNIFDLSQQVHIMINRIANDTTVIASLKIAAIAFNSRYAGRELLIFHNSMLLPLKNTKQGATSPVWSFPISEARHRMVAFHG
jgi:hypothetical protein